MYFDSHAHLDDPRFDQDREALLAAMPEAGIDYIMNVGCDLPSSQRSVALAKQYPFVFAAVGSHPESADRLTDETLACYRALCREEKVRAIGEIGLDYHYEDVPREIQKIVFERQLLLAEELGLPVIVHEREAHQDGLEIVRRHPKVRGVFHCFSGSAEMARELVELGWCVGFTGVLTFQNARKAVEVAKTVPLSHILIETDCPYMAPMPYRGKRCDSRMVALVGQKLAELRGISAQEAARITTENARRLFRIPDLEENRMREKTE